MFRPWGSSSASWSAMKGWTSLCSNSNYSEHSIPFTYIISGLPFTFVRDFLRVSLEVKIVCTPSGLHALLIFLLKPLLDARKNTLAIGRPLWHPSRVSSSASWYLLASGTHLPWEPFGHAFFHLPGQIYVGISVSALNLFQCISYFLYLGGRVALHLLVAGICQ